MKFMNGHLLRPEELTEVNLSDTEICSVCHGLYFTTAHKATTCYGCYYEGAMKNAEHRFSALTQALAKRLEVMPTVDQTGGMTMCLRVQLGDRYYAYFSELTECDPGEIFFCIYDNLDEYCEDQIIHSMKHEFKEDEDGSDWNQHPELCEQVAAWAVPIMLEHMRSHGV